MTDTALRPTVRTTPHGAAALLGGIAVVVLGAIGAINGDLVGPAWFVTAVPAALLFVVGLVGLRSVVTASRVAVGATTVAAVGMTLFALDHLVVLANEDLGILLLSVFMVVSALSLVVAGIAMLRSTVPAALGWATLVAGVWPLATIPAGAALGDLPHFGAIAVWGVTWAVLGGLLISRSS